MTVRQKWTIATIGTIFGIVCTIATVIGVAAIAQHQINQDGERIDKVEKRQNSDHDVLTGMVKDVEYVREDVKWIRGTIEGKD
jgi:hypothetical protein